MIRAAVVNLQHGFAVAVIMKSQIGLGNGFVGHIKDCGDIDFVSVCLAVIFDGIIGLSA